MHPSLRQRFSIVCGLLDGKDTRGTKAALAEARFRLNLVAHGYQEGTVVPTGGKYQGFSAISGLQGG